MGPPATINDPTGGTPAKGQMKRHLSKVQVGDGLTRYRVRYESDECVKGTIDSRIVQCNLLRELGEQPLLSACGTQPFETMHMYHNGSCWIVELEAFDRDPRGSSG